MAAQPFTVEQAAAGDLDAQAGASEAVDRLAIKILRGLIRCQQGARARLGPQRPLSGGTGGLRERFEGVSRGSVRRVSPGKLAASWPARSCGTGQQNSTGPSLSWFTSP